MKIFKLILAPIACVLMSAAIAQEDLPAKRVMIPFSNVPMFSSEHSGLTFTYSMEGMPAKKVICKIYNTYKAWLEFRDAGAAQESYTYGGDDTIIFTSVGNSHSVDDNTDVYHADALGNIKINGIFNDREGENSSASCYYEADDNVK